MLRPEIRTIEIIYGFECIDDDDSSYYPRPRIIYSEQLATIYQSLCFLSSSDLSVRIRFSI